MQLVAHSPCEACRGRHSRNTRVCRVPCGQRSENLRFVTVLFENTMPPRPITDVRTPEHQKGRDGPPRSRDSRPSQVRFPDMSCNHAGHPTHNTQKTSWPKHKARSDYLTMRAGASGRCPPPATARPVGLGLPDASNARAQVILGRVHSRLGS